MSKRSEEAALRMFPEKLTAGAAGYGYGMYPFTYDMNQQARYGAVKGYEQAEKDTLDRVCKWLEEHATYIHPRKGIKTCFINLNALREAMEEEP